MSDIEPVVSEKPSRWYVVILVGLPVWFAVSVVGALWLYFHLQEREAGERQAAFAREISIASLADDLRKFTSLIGERHTGGDEPGRNLSRAASMVEGALGPGNIGLEVSRHRGPSDWSLIETAIPAARQDADSVWVLTGYDAPRGGIGGQFNASGLAAVLAAIQAGANDEPVRHLRFLFLPHLHDEGAPVAETLRIAAETMTARGGVDSVLWVEAMGAAQELELRAKNPEALPVDNLADIGEVSPEPFGLEFGDGVPSWLGEAMVRVSTRGPHQPGEPDIDVPSPTLTADAAGMLLELLRRVSGVETIDPGGPAQR